MTIRSEDQGETRIGRRGEKRRQLARARNATTPRPLDIAIVIAALCAVIFLPMPGKSHAGAVGDQGLGNITATVAASSG